MTNLLNRRSTVTMPTAPPRSSRTIGIGSDDVINYCFPKNRPTDRERRAAITCDCLKTEARFLAS